MEPNTHLSVIPPDTSEGADLATIERRLASWDAKRAVVLKVLNSSDVARMGSRLAKNKFAAEKLLRIFGGKLELLKDPDGRPIVEKTMVEDDPDMGRVVIFTTYSKYTAPDGLVFEAAGSFSSKDDFFAKDQGAFRAFADVNLADILSAAFTESMKKAIFRGCGLGDFDESEQTQVMAGQAAGHAFTGSRKITSTDPEIGWGNSKGKKVSELDLKDAAYYLPKYQASLEDPDKAKWAKANKAAVDALTAHIMRLKGSAPTPSDPAVEGEAAPPLAADQPEMPTTRGGKIKACFEKLEQHAGKSSKAQAGLLRAVTTAWGGPATGTLSELTDDQLRALLEMSDEQLTEVKEHAA